MAVRVLGLLIQCAPADVRSAEELEPCTSRSGWSESSKRSRSPGSGSLPSALWQPSSAPPGPCLHGERHVAYERARQDVGRAVLLGLEVLIIADIVQTITIDATIESAVTLALIVLVRTFLSFSLEIELEGVVPWHRRRRDNDRSERAVAASHDGADATTS